MEKPIMIMGADVTHSASGDTRSPPLAAVRFIVIIQSTSKGTQTLTGTL